MYVLYGFIEGALVIFYILLISIKLHIIHMLIHIENKMEPFRRDDDEDFLHNIICEGTQHQGPFEGDTAEYDGSEYLNDSCDGDADWLDEMVVEDVRTEVYGIRAYIYKQLHELCMYVQHVPNRHFSRHPN